MDYMVVYSSKTGNTKKIATEIFSALPGMSKDMQSMREYRGKDADVFFIGFWVNRGTCDISVIEMMSGLHGKKIALFGSDDCEYLGTFLCQGKMPMQVRGNYEIPMEDPKQEVWRKKMLQNFDEGLFHPNEDDLWQAREFVEQVLSRV